MCLQFKIIQQSCSTRTWLHKMGLFNSQTWIEFWGPKCGRGDNMWRVYISQILWLSGPHTYLSIALSLSRHPVPFPTYKYWLALWETRWNFWLGHKGKKMENEFGLWHDTMFPKCQTKVSVPTFSEAGEEKCWPVFPKDGTGWSGTERHSTPCPQGLEDGLFFGDFQFAAGSL